MSDSVTPRRPGASWLDEVRGNEPLNPRSVKSGQVVRAIQEALTQKSPMAPVFSGDQRDEITYHVAAMFIRGSGSDMELVLIYNNGDAFRVVVEEAEIR